MFRTFQEFVKYLSQSIFKNLVKTSSKGKGITEISPALKFKAEKMAENAAEVLQKNNKISYQNLTKSDVDGLADNIVSPIKNAEQVSVKSADILPFRFKRSFAEELKDASKKGDFNRMTDIMKVDPKFKEVMESLKASKAADAAKAEMIGPKRLIPDRDVIPYQSPEVQKLNFADKLKRSGLTEQEYMDNIVKRGYNVDDAIYARDFYGDTTEDIIRNANTKGEPVAFAGGGVAGLLGERPGYNKGLKVQGSGSISGKNQIQGAPEGITSNTSFINLIANLDIPISEKISLLSDVQYNKFRDKIERGDEELFIEDPASYINKKIGIGINQGNKGFSGSAKYDVDSGEPEFNILFKKSFAQGGRTGFKGGGADAGGKSSPGGGTFGGGGNGNARENYRTQQYTKPKTKTTPSGGDGGKTTTIPKTNPRGFPTTRTLQPSLFERINTHFVNNQKLKDAVARGDITQEDYNVLGGYDAKQTLKFGPVMTGITSAAYNAVQSALGPKFSGGNQPLFDGASDVGRNVFGSTLDPNSAYAQQYNKIMNLADGGPARQNFKMGKRAFLKLIGGVGAGIAGLKSGLLGFGKGATKKAVTETVKQTAGSGTPPPYFFKLVEKIKTLGNDTLATQDKVIAKKYKDYTLEEDFSGNIEIIKKGDVDNPNLEDVYMSYKVDEVPIKGKKGSTKVEEYEEFTARPDSDGKMKDVEQGVPDEVVMEVEAGSGNVPESFYTGLNKIKKADGGRIGFKFGSGKGIMAVINKLFGKGTMTTADKISQPEKTIQQRIMEFEARNKPTVNEFLNKRKFIKSMVGNTEKNKNARELRMLKDAMEEARKNPGFKFENVDIDKDIRPIFDKEIAESLKKNRKLNATGGLANMLGE